jgi:hypothetical protein
MKIRKINSTTDLLKVDIETRKNILRQMREEQCYPYINRGELWYGKLTEEQKTELNVWYQLWLNVTDSLIIPQKPLWL